MNKDMTAGKKRNVGLLGRELRHFRRVNLMSSGACCGIDPSRWVQTKGAKQFDDKNTALLRVYKHKTEDKYLVHGMRSQLASGAKIATVIVETYETVALADAVPVVVEQVAKHCGVEALIGELK